jgi:hypothetical protein
LAVTMVFSGLLKSSKSSGDLPPHRSNGGNSPPPLAGREIEPTGGGSSQDKQTYVVEADLALVDYSDEPDLRELNSSLASLAAIFPDVQIEVFREMLSSFDKESRLAVVTEALLRDKMKWARGRYRVIEKERAEGKGKTSEPGVSGAVPGEERFRSAGYIKAVKTITYHEFRGLPKSTINAVLAEHNYSYTLAQPTLATLSSKSWRFSLSSIFWRRKPVSLSEAEHHPLVVWQSTGYGSIIPTLKATGSPELDKELFEMLIVPLQRKSLAEREAKDHAIAVEINMRQAEEAEALHDCECCFVSSPFEGLSACDQGGHFVCNQCVRQATNEAVFGQGWSRNIDIPKGSLRCLAPTSGDCNGCIPQDLLRRALLEENGGDKISRQFDERLAEDSLLKTQLPLIRCPFCSYVEVDELYLPESKRSWRFRRNARFPLYALIFLCLGVGMIPFLILVFLVISVMFVFSSPRRTFGDFATERFKASVSRMRRRQQGLKFICQNPHCKRHSCMSCSKAWTDIHICHESSLLALRTQVELAMSLAIKRTCPRCNTSFVKSSGCNKLTCVCGYQMCYVCRKDIGNGEGYRHFCEHFRPNGGRGCTECSKCDLYHCEDDEVVVKKAKEDAERQWMEKEGTSLETNDAIRKVIIEKYHPGKETGWRQMKMPEWDKLIDALVEGMIE